MAQRSRSADTSPNNIPVSAKIIANRGGLVVDCILKVSIVSGKVIANTSQALLIRTLFRRIGCLFGGVALGGGLLTRDGHVGNGPHAAGAAVRRVEHIDRVWVLIRCRSGRRWLTRPRAWPSLLKARINIKAGCKLRHNAFFSVAIGSISYCQFGAKGERACRIMAY